MLLMPGESPLNCESQQQSGLRLDAGCDAAWPGGRCKLATWPSPLRRHAAGAAVHCCIPAASAGPIHFSSPSRLRADREAGFYLQGEALHPVLLEGGIWKLPTGNALPCKQGRGALALLAQEAPNQASEASCCQLVMRPAQVPTLPGAPAGPEVVNWTIWANKSQVMVMVANRSIIETACPVGDKGEPQPLGGWSHVWALPCPSALLQLLRTAAPVHIIPAAPSPARPPVCDYRRIWKYAVPGTLCFWKEW